MIKRSLQIHRIGKKAHPEEAELRKKLTKIMDKYPHVPVLIMHNLELKRVFSKGKPLIVLTDEDLSYASICYCMLYS